ncbi:MAG: hypothetical protein ABI147_04630 [Acidobacteriaceae bacterium]
MSSPSSQYNGQENYDNMTVAEFEARLPDLFVTGHGKISKDPRFANFLRSNPDCAALVSDLETIAEHAASLFGPPQEPSDAVWSNIASKLKDDANSLAEPNGAIE